MGKQYLGIDIGGTAVKMGVVSENGEIIAFHSHSVNFDNYRTPIIETVVKEADIFLQMNQISPKMISGIGVSATGQINTRKGMVAGAAGHIANWLGTPVKDILEEHFHKPVCVVNDANCAVVGEQWLGAAQGAENVVMITIGTGVGGGIITGNHLLSGALGIAAEVGHITIKKDGMLCPCGNRGCFEQYGSTTALVKAVARVMDVPAETIDGRWTFRQAASGNGKIQNVIDAWIEDIAAGVVGLVHIFNPEIVIIGGGVSREKKLFVEPLAEKIRQGVMPVFRQGLKVCAAELGNEAGLLGAVACCKAEEEKR